MNLYISYFLEHFFLSLYSCFDIFAQITNTILNIGEKEDEVSFKKIVDRVSQKKIERYMKKNILKLNLFEFNLE